MGSGSYSRAVYACLSKERGYDTSTADVVFANKKLSSLADIKTSNVHSRSKKSNGRRQKSLGYGVMVVTSDFGSESPGSSPGSPTK